MASRLRSPENNAVETVLLELLRNRYFGGKYTWNNFTNKIYSAILDDYAFADGERRHLNIKGVKFPSIIKEEDLVIFINELYDILFYHFIENKELVNIFLNEGPYELNDVHINSGDVVIDCGANMGLFSALATYKGAEVYAFEPNNYVVDTYLSKTADLNPNMHICKYALSDKLEELKFILPNSGNIGGGHLNLVPIPPKSCQSQSAQAIPLDDFVRKNNLAKIDFIKADIEGAERNMLMGAQYVLREFSPKLSICTYHLPDDPLVLKKLILQANPAYIIEEKWKKMYAHVPMR